MTETKLWEWMMEGNYPPNYDKNYVSLERRATAKLTKDVHTTRWQGHGKKEKKITLQAGSKVKVVMASRLGDVGITNIMNAHNGYIYRVQCVEAEMMGQVIGPENLLTDISPIEDPDTSKLALAFGEVNVKNI
jgi:hypothetical protein